jgi:CelD/BcsL family acetyltransferase involved in cellulose biosynthesis
VSLRVCESLEEFDSLESSWDRLALPAQTPFLTHEWFRAWWSAFGHSDAIAAVLDGPEPGIRAGAVLVRRTARAITAAANAYSGAWDVVAGDDASRRALWRGIADLPGARLTMAGMPAASPSVDVAAEGLAAGGYRVGTSPYQLSPYVELPDSWDELLETLSRNQRSKVRKQWKRLEREGDVVFRTTTGPDLQGDLDRFLRLEASGWKGAAGTAILDDPAALRLYTEFAHAAATRGWFRLHLLELDGTPIAGGYSCVLGDAAFLMKTCFDERYARLGPGATMRAAALRAAIDEGVSRYEFLGAADPHKLHWGGGLREHLLLSAYRGASLPAFYYRHRLRPLARRALDRGRARLGADDADPATAPATGPG